LLQAPDQKKKKKKKTVFWDKFIFKIAAAALPIWPTLVKKKNSLLCVSKGYGLCEAIDTHTSIPNMDSLVDESCLVISIASQEEKKKVCKLTTRKSWAPRIEYNIAPTSDDLRAQFTIRYKNNNLKKKKLTGYV
jgi:hypothetical protein